MSDRDERIAQAMAAPERHDLASASKYPEAAPPDAVVRDTEVAPHRLFLASLYERVEIAGATRSKWRHR